MKTTVQKKANLGWFGGLFDGDGTLRFGIDNRNRLYTQLVLELNDEETVAEADRVLTETVGYKVSRFSRICASGFSRNRKYGMRVQARHPLVKILEALTPHVVLKRRKVEAVREVLSRADVDPRCRDPRYTYQPSARDVKLIETFKGRRDFDPKRDIDPVDRLSWLGGLIDAEGSFILTEKNTLFAINMTSGYAIDKVARYIEHFCGFEQKVYLKRPVSPLSKQDQFYIHVRSQRLSRLIEVVSPYLVAKKLQADLIQLQLRDGVKKATAIRLCKHLKQHRREAREESIKILRDGNPVPSQVAATEKASWKAQRLEDEPVAGDKSSKSAQRLN